MKTRLPMTPLGFLNRSFFGENDLTDREATAEPNLYMYLLTLISENLYDKKKQERCVKQNKIPCNKYMRLNIRNKQY